MIADLGPLETLEPLVITTNPTDVGYAGDVGSAQEECKNLRAAILEGLSRANDDSFDRLNATNRCSRPSCAMSDLNRPCSQAMFRSSRSTRSKRVELQSANFQLSLINLSNVWSSHRCRLNFRACRHGPSTSKTDSACLSLEPWRSRRTI